MHFLAAFPRMPRTLGVAKPAFYAYMSYNEINPSQHHTIIFDHVIVNFGNAYSEYAGIFIAPTTGIYAFSYAITAYADALIPIEIVCNGEVIGSSVTITQGAYQDNDASTVVIQLSADDVCFIRTSSTYGISSNIYSGTYARSSFAGWLISK